MWQSEQGAVQVVQSEWGDNLKSQNRTNPEVNLGQVWGGPLASSRKISKNKPLQATFAPFVDNMAQEPDRYHLPVFRASPLPFWSSNAKSLAGEFSRNSPFPTPWRKSEIWHTSGGGDTHKGKNLGPRSHFGEVMGSKFQLSHPSPKIGSSHSPMPPQTLKIS